MHLCVCGWGWGGVCGAFEIEPRALHMLGNHFAIELFPEQEWFVYVTVCMHALHVCLGVLTYVCVCMLRPEIDFSTLFFWDRVTH